MIDASNLVTANSFPLLRRFSIASLLAMLATAALLILLYRQDQLAEHENIAAQQSEQIAIHFMQLLGGQIDTLVSTSNGLDPRALQANPGLGLLPSAQEIVREHDILKLRIYNMSGAIIYSSAREEIGGNSLHPDFLAKALSGEATYRHEFRNTFHNATSEMHDVYVDLSYLPLNYVGKRIGAIEIYRDSTPGFVHLNTNTTRIPLIVLGIFSLLYAALFFYIRKADRGIAEWQKFIHDTALTSESQQLLSRFVANVPGFIFSFRMSPEGCFSFPFASLGINEIYGLHPEDVRDDMTALHELAHPEDAPRIEDIIAKAARTMTAIQMELRVLRPGYAERWVEYRSTPEREADGGIIWHGIMIDITERKQAEFELHQRAQEFRALVENSPDPIVRYDRDGRRLYLNPALAQLSGKPIQSLLGVTPETAPLLPAKEQDKLSACVRHVLESVQPAECDVEFVTPDGQTYVFHNRYVPEFGHDGKVISVLSISTDITKRKRAEQQIREFSAHLQTVREEEKASFAREIHDELGGTLFALKMQAYVLDCELSASSKNTPPSAHIESISQLIDSAIASMRSIITDLRPAILDDLGLPAAIKWQAEQFHKRTGIECLFDCIYQKEKRCNDCKDCECKLDEVPSINLFRIFQEALTNVVRHSGASRVAVEFRPSNNEISLSITDNGRGLPEGHTIASTSYGIRGMRERVIQLGGIIEFSSPQDGGFSVKVKLPLPSNDMEETLAV